MARSYKRDKNGRFSSGGGGGGSKAATAAADKPKSKAAMTKAADKSRAADLKSKGTTGLGDRVKAKGFKGKKAVETAGGLRSSGRATAAPRAGMMKGKKGGRSAVERHGADAAPIPGQKLQYYAPQPVNSPKGAGKAKRRRK